MARFLFVHQPVDGQASGPYAVLTGIAIEDAHVWNLARKVNEAHLQYFGAPLTVGLGLNTSLDILLGVRVYESVGSRPNKSPGASDKTDRLGESGASAYDSASSTAKIAYCEHVLSMANDFQTAAIAIFTLPDSGALPTPGRLRKDYAYLVERFYAFLSGAGQFEMGLLMLESSSFDRSIGNVRDLLDYFKNTTNGRVRAQRIVPEPVYVNAHLGAISHIATLFSYVASWGVRLPGMDKDRRPELSSLVKACNTMRFSYLAENGKKDWSFKYLADLKPSTVSQGASRPIHR